MVEPVDILPSVSSSSDEESEEPQEPEGSDDDKSDNDEQYKSPQHQEAQVTKESSYEDSEDTLSVSAFRVDPILPRYVSKSPQSKSPVATTKIDMASEPSLGNQQIGKERVGNNGKRPVEVEKIDKVTKNKKIKVYGDGVGKEDEGPQGKEMRRGIKWREEDEIVLLGGIIDYKAKTGDDVNSKMVAFYEYVKDLLSIMFTKSQVYEKIRRLKKKFQDNDEKCKNGEEPVFSRPHKNKLFEISQKIWGSPDTANIDREVECSMNKDKRDGIVAAGMPLKSPIESATKREFSVHEQVKDTITNDTPDFLSLYPRLYASLESESCGFLTRKVGDRKEYVKKIIIKLGEEKARELEEEWKVVFVMDHQVYARRTYLISKQANFMLDSLKHDVEESGTSN